MYVTTTGPRRPYQLCPSKSLIGGTCFPQTHTPHPITPTLKNLLPPQHTHTHCTPSHALYGTAAHKSSPNCNAHCSAVSCAALFTALQYALLICAVLCFAALVCTCSGFCPLEWVGVVVDCADKGSSTPIKVLVLFIVWSYILWLCFVIKIQFRLDGTNMI